MADPNWLYSSVVQSSAAIVAIVGGFVASTILSLSVQRRNLDDELEEQERDLAAAQRDHEEAWSKHEQLRAAHLLWDRVDDVVNFPRPLPSSAEVAARLRAGEIRTADFAEVWERFRADIERVEQLVTAEIARHGFDNVLFSKWKTAHGIEVSDQDDWLAEGLWYRELRKSPLPEDGASHKPLTRSLYATEMAQLDAALFSDSNSAELLAAERDREAARAAKLDRYREEAADANRRAQRIAARLELLRERGRAVQAPPPNIWVAFTGLAFLAVAGIIVPLLLMPQAESDYRTWHKAGVVALFSVGLVWVFGYFVALLLLPRRMRNHSAGNLADGPQ